jgi:hypothetical protein
VAPGALAVLLSLFVVVAACSDSSSDGGPDAARSGPTEPPAAPSTDPGAPESAYEWSVLPIGAGGWVTGIVLHSLERDVAYARTDVSGAYRYEADTEAWVQMLTVEAVVDDTLEQSDYVVESIAVAPTDPDVVFLSVGNDDPAGDPADASGRVLRSRDGGRTWHSSERRFAISGNAAHRQRSERLAVDPTDEEHLLLGTRREGLWRSRDGGHRWQRVGAVPAGPGHDHGGAPAGISFVTWGSGDHRDHVWVGVAGEGIFTSDDGGVTWNRQPVRPDLDGGAAPFEGAYAGGRLVVAFNRVDGNGPGQVERLDVDRGVWSDITPPHRAPDWSVAMSPHDPDRLVAAADAVRNGYLWRSDDGGDRWQSVDVAQRSPAVPWLEDDDEWMFVGRLRFDPHVEDRLWFAEGRGVWTADDVFDGSTVTWHANLRGLEQTVTADLLVSPSGDPISAVADHQGFVHRSLDSYPEQTLVDDRFAGGTGLAQSTGEPDHLVWIGAEYHRYYDPSRVGRGALTRDGGATWEELPNLTADHFGGNVALSSSDPDNIVWIPSYMHPYGFDDEPRGIFVTDDGGGSWNQILDEMDGEHRYHRLVWWLTRRALAADRFEGGVFYLNDDEQRFWVSDDGGFTWELAPHGPPCEEWNDCHVFGQLRASPTRAGEVWASVARDGLYRSHDAGATEWQQVTGIAEARAFDFGAPLSGASDPALYVHGRTDDDDELGVWRSPDLGETWDLIARHPLGIDRGVSVLTADPQRAGRVYLGTPGVGFLYGDDPTERGP